MVRPAVKPFGASKPDWWITCQVARKMGINGFEFENASEIMAEISAVTPIYECISYEILAKGSVRWPVLKDHVPSYDTKPKFAQVYEMSWVELVDEDYPLLLTSVNDLYFFHPGAMEAGLPEFNNIAASAELMINPVDARILGIEDGDTVSVISRWGNVEANAKIVADVLRPGVVSMPLHFISGVLNPMANQVSHAQAYQPCAVRLQKPASAPSFEITSIQTELKSVQRQEKNV